MSDRPVVTVDRRALGRELVAAVREDRDLRRELAAALELGARADLVSVAAFAAARSISQSTVRAAIREGRLEATKIGRAIRIATDATIRSTTDRDATSLADRRLGVVQGGRR